jgi:hypothetical protein
MRFAIESSLRLSGSAADHQAGGAMVHDSDDVSSASGDEQQVGQHGD